MPEEIVRITEGVCGKIVNFLPEQVTLDMIVEIAIKEFPDVAIGDLTVRSRVVYTTGKPSSQMSMWQHRG